MKNHHKRPYKITVLVSGNTKQLENRNTDGSYTFAPHGNCRTTEKSAIAAVKQICALCGCKVEKIINIEKTEVLL